MIAQPERPEGSVVMRRAALWIGTMLAAGAALATPFAYVPNEQQQLTVIDLGTNSVVTRITTESTTFGVAATNTNRVYVSDFATGTVQVIDSAINSTIATLNICAQPGVPVANTTATRLLVPCRRTANDPGGVMVIDTSTFGLQVATAAPDPLAAAWSPDASRYYVTSTDRMSIIDAATNELVAAVPVTPGAFAIAVNAANTKVYVASFGASGGAGPAISVIDWGIQLTKRRNNIMAAWFTYDDGGSPIWYVAPGCILGTPLSCSGSLYRVTDVKFFGGPYDFSLARIDVVGSLQLQFTSVNNGGMSNSVAGQSRFVPIEREHVATGTAIPAVNYTDIWWNPAESGWGLTVTHQPGNMFLAWFVYDTNRQPTWFVSSCAATSDQNGCSGTLLRVTGPRFGAVFDSSLVHATSAGTVSLRFTDPDNGVLTYTVDGVDGTKTITREIF